MPKKRSDREREADRETTAELYLMGWSYRAIAKEISGQYDFNLSFQTIANDIQENLAECREHRIANTDEAVQAEIEKLNNIEKAAWASFHRGIESGEDDPRWLAQAEKCGARRASLLGLDAPKKREITGAGGGPIQTSTIDVSKLNDEDLEHLERMRS